MQARRIEGPKSGGSGRARDRSGAGSSSIGVCVGAKSAASAAAAATRRSSPPRHNILPPPQGLLDGLFGRGGGGGAAAATSFSERPAYPKRDMLKIGGLDVSPMGMGTWSWGNRFLFDYSPEMDPELQRVFDLCVSKGINLFDTADSYGTGALNGRSEQLLGQFTR